MFEEHKVYMLDKPYKWTSYDVIRYIRKNYSIKKIGHTGTLDPLATGLLIIATGIKTKTISSYLKMDKEYKGAFFLGAVTDSFDLEKEPKNFISISNISEENILNASRTFLGEINQVPPKFSAIKQKGKPVYLLARRDIDFQLQPRIVKIFDFKITKIELPLVYFTILCSSGTYIRSIASDFGIALGCGAYLHSLCRTRIGEFDLKDSISLDSVQRFNVESFT